MAIASTSAPEAARAPHFLFTQAFSIKPSTAELTVDGDTITATGLGAGGQTAADDVNRFNDACTTRSSSR
jgi:hypothetical protein